MPVVSDTDDCGLSAEDLEALRVAKVKLEYPSLTARISAFVGRPLEAGVKMLPDPMHRVVNSAAKTALLKGLEFAVLTMGKRSPRRAQNWLHKALVFGTGATGGAIGIVALPVELPLSTCVMLRSIADVARNQGHDPSMLDTKLACLEVFALGGPTPADDPTESGYWVVRSALSTYLRDAAHHIAQKGLWDQSAPAVVRLIAKIASRFSLVVTEETVAKALPVVGGVFGGSINYLFLDHFQDVAQGHFTVMRLEKMYGTEVVRRAYEQMVV